MNDTTDQMNGFTDAEALAAAERGDEADQIAEATTRILDAVHEETEATDRKEQQ